MQRLLMIVVAIFLLILGAIFFPLPIPLGAPLLAVGFILLISASPAFARFVAVARRRWPRLDNALAWIEARAPKGLAEILRRTR